MRPSPNRPPSILDIATSGAVAARFELSRLRSHLVAVNVSMACDKTPIRLAHESARAMRLALVPWANVERLAAACAREGVSFSLVAHSPMIGEWFDLANRALRMEILLEDIEDSTLRSRIRDCSVIDDERYLAASLVVRKIADNARALAVFNPPGAGPFSGSSRDGGRA